MQGQGEVWAVFHTVTADGGRRQLLTIALSINLGTAVLKTLLVSFDLRPLTAKQWLPSSRHVVFKPSCVPCAFCTFPGTSSLKEWSPQSRDLLDGAARTVQVHTDTCISLFCAFQ